MFRFFTVIVTFRPQGMPHNHIKIFLFPWIMLDTIKILLFLPFQKKPSLCLHALCYIHHFAHSHRRRSTFPPSPTGMLPQNHHCSRFMPQGIKKKKISQYLHVLPVIYDGGFSKWLAPRYVLLSLAMLWNQLNYITT